MAERQDVAIARAQMSPSIGYWRDIADVERLLPRDEEVWRMAGGEYAGESGVVVATDRRVVFVAAGEIRWSVDADQLDTPRCACGEMFAVLTIDTRVGTFTIRRVDRRDGKALVEVVGGRCSRRYGTVARGAG
jgi:hypothetical protein